MAETTASVKRVEADEEADEEYPEEDQEERPPVIQEATRVV